MGITVNTVHNQTRPGREAGMAGYRAEDADTRSLWFNPPDEAETSRRALTRERVVTEALTVISADGAQALSMRALASRLGVVPGALYRHVRSKEQLHDLILDAVLAEVDCRTDPALPWTAQVAALAHRLRTVLENHPGIAALLKTRDPLGPASPALAEAFLAALHAAGLPGRRAALAFRLIYDYTLGFALADLTSPAEQRLRDSATRQQVHAFLRALPASSFPTLAAYGTHAWADDREQRFTSGLDTLIRGLQAAQRLFTPSPPAGQPAEMSPSGPDSARRGPGLGEAAMQRDGGAGNGRPPAPHRGEPGNGEPGNNDDGNQVDDAE
jgi:AcrR family transcriptional regulator